MELKSVAFCIVDLKTKGQYLPWVLVCEIEYLKCFMGTSGINPGSPHGSRGWDKGSSHERSLGEKKLLFAMLGCDFQETSGYTWRKIHPYNQDETKLTVSFVTASWISPVSAWGRNPNMPLPDLVISWGIGIWVEVNIKLPD